MADKEFLSEGLSDIEDALFSLVPKSSGIDRDRLLFLAGQASASQLPHTMPRRIRLWQITSALSTTAAVVLGVMLAVRGQPEVIHEIQFVNRNTNESPAAVSPDRTLKIENQQSTPYFPPPSYLSFENEWSPQQSYLRRREIALNRGIDALTYLDPIPTGNSQKQTTPRAPITYWNGLQRLLEQDQYNETDTQAVPGEFDGDSLNNRGEQL
ncbi:MAG: hypothetical protein IH899_14990 [Planctomycetes bacterium]|nr:hypothetical protein [Planctomycetota bacterium]